MYNLEGQCARPFELKISDTLVIDYLLSKITKGLTDKGDEKMKKQTIGMICIVVVLLLAVPSHAAVIFSTLGPGDT